MPHRVLDHTADTGIEATAGSVAELLHELAAGMFALMSSLEAGQAKEWVTVQVESPTLSDLVFDALSELLYQAEVEDLVLCDFRVAMEGDGAVTISAGGVPIVAAEATGPPIKAVTYHDLVIEERDGGWYGRVYFDV
jgi:SHS2 domain-containing protein